MENTISQAMVEDHKKIEAVFKELLENMNAESFSKLQWILNRHFAVEETAILTQYDFKDEDMRKKIDCVIKDHKVLLQQAKLVDVSSEKELEMFIKKLKAHSMFEDEVLYPMLDRVLSQDKIRETVAKIEEELQ